MRKGEVEWDLVTSWQRFIDTFDELLEEHPSLLPLVRQWVGTFAFASSPTLQEIFEKSLRRIRPRGSRAKTARPENDISEGADCDVLFIPRSMRSNYLAACQTVASTLWERTPTLRLGIIPPHNRTGSGLAELDSRFIQCNPLSGGRPLGQDIRQGYQLWSAIYRASRRDKTIHRWIRATSPRRIIELIWFLRNVRQAQTWLHQSGCRLIVSANDLLPPASYLIASARAAGVATCQILHGSPTRLYWPFLSDETWTWDRQTSKTLQDYGAPEQRLSIVGNLEALYWAGLARSDEFMAPETPKNASRTCLFLSQWHGSSDWGVKGFEEPLTWLRDALVNTSGWDLHVRLHPLEGESVKQEITHHLAAAGIVAHFSGGDVPLLKDILQADLVFTGSSTAGLMSLTVGRPTRFIWTDTMAYLHGEPFVNSDYVLHTPQAVQEILQDNLLEQPRLPLANGVDSPADNAARRILYYLEN